MCALDWIDSDDYSFAFFYLFPIGFTTWFAGKRYGMVIATLTAINSAVDNNPHMSLAHLWNTISTFAVFIVISRLVSIVRSMWENERRLSRIDHLTELLNSRAFVELIDYEIERFKRGGKAFSVAYIDLDEFKAVNDRYGHQRGDELLKLVADLFRSNLRKTDVVARMGGDEFAMFFPASRSEDVKVALPKLMGRFQEAMKVNHWPTTFSMGVVSFEVPPSDADEVILLADKQMYRAKGTGKNRIEFSLYSAIN